MLNTSPAVVHDRKLPPRLHEVHVSAERLGLLRRGEDLEECPAVSRGPLTLGVEQDSRGWVASEDAVVAWRRVSAHGAGPAGRDRADRRRIRAACPAAEGLHSPHSRQVRISGLSWPRNGSGPLAERAGRLGHEQRRVVSPRRPRPRSWRREPSSPMRPAAAWWRSQGAGSEGWPDPAG